MADYVRRAMWWFTLGDSTKNYGLKEINCGNNIRAGVGGGRSEFGLVSYRATPPRNKINVTEIPTSHNVGDSFDQSTVRM